MAREKKKVTITIDPRKLKGFTRGQQLLQIGHFQSAAETWIKSMTRLIKEKDYQKAGFVALQAHELLVADLNSIVIDTESDLEKEQKEKQKNEKTQIIAHFLTQVTSKLKKYTSKDNSLPPAQRQLLGHFTQIHNGIALGYYTKGDFSNATKYFLLANDAYNDILVLTGQTHMAFLYEVQRNLMLYKATIAQLCLKDHEKAEDIFRIAEDNYIKHLSKTDYDINDQDNCIALECQLIFNIIRTTVNVAVDKIPSKEELLSCVASADELLKNMYLSYETKYITIAEIINMLELVRSKLQTPVTTILRITEICYQLALCSNKTFRIDYKSTANEITSSTGLELRPHVIGVQLMEVAINETDLNQHINARENFIKATALFDGHSHFLLDITYAHAHSAIFNRHYCDIRRCTEKSFSLLREVFKQKMLPKQYQDELKKYQDYSNEVISACRMEAKFSDDETTKHMWNSVADTAESNLSFMEQFVNQKSKEEQTALPEQQATVVISDENPLLASNQSPLQYCTDAIETIEKVTSENIDKLDSIARKINTQYVICQSLLQSVEDESRKNLLAEQCSEFGDLIYTAGALAKNLELDFSMQPDILFALSWLHYTQQEYNDAAQLWIKMVANHPKTAYIDLVWLMIYQNNHSEILKAKATLEYLNAVEPLLEKNSTIHLRHLELIAHNHFLIAADHLCYKNYTEALPALLESRKRIEKFEHDQQYAISACVNGALLASCYIRLNDFPNASKYLKKACDIVRNSKIDGKGLQTLTLGCEINLKLSSNDTAFDPFSILPFLKQHKEICDRITPIDDYLVEILFNDVESIATHLEKQIRKNHLSAQTGQITHSLIGKLLQILQYAKYNQRKYQLSEMYYHRLSEFYSDDLSNSLHLLCETTSLHDNGKIEEATTKLTEAKLLIPQKSDGLFILSVFYQDTIGAILDRDVSRLTKIIPSVKVLLTSIINENNSDRIKNAYYIFADVTNHIINYCEIELAVKSSIDRQEIAKKLLHYTLVACLQKYSQLDKMSFRSETRLEPLSSDENIVQLAARATLLSPQITEPLGTKETSEQCVKVLGLSKEFSELISRLVSNQQDEETLFKTAHPTQHHEEYNTVFFNYVKLKRDILDHERYTRYLLSAIDTEKFSAENLIIVLKNVLKNHIKLCHELHDQTNAAHDKRMKPNAYPHFYQVAFYSGIQDRRLRRSLSLRDLFCSHEETIVRLSANL